MPAPSSHRPPLPVRIAAWRRRIVVGSLGVFLAAWLAVLGLGRQSASPAAAGTTPASRSTTTQAQSTSTDPQTDTSQSGTSQSNSSPSDSSQIQTDSSQASSSQDLSGATTSQS